MAIHDVIPKVGGLAGAGAKSGRSKPLSFHDYAVAILIALGLAVFLGVYLLIRRGYFFGAPPTADVFFVPDKAIIGVAIILLGFTFLIGPIARYFDSFDHLVRYRKEIGIVAGFFALFHAVVSYFFLPLKFPRSGLDFTSIVYGAGLVGVFLVVFLVLISFQKAIDILGGNRWWFSHRFGLRLLILFVVIHVFVMKWSGWVKWVKQGGGHSSAELARPWMPGAGILVSMFLTWVIIVRVYETVFLYRDFGFKPKEITRDENLRRRGRRFFVYSFWVLIACYVFIGTRWI